MEYLTRGKVDLAHADLQSDEEVLHLLTKFAHKHEDTAAGRKSECFRHSMQLQSACGSDDLQFTNYT